MRPRRNYFINKGLQSRFVAGFSLAVLAGLLANLFIAYFLIDRELAQELYKIHIKIRTTSEIAVPILIKLSAITVSAILVFSAVIGFFLTRRIELPLLELREAVRRISRGDFTQSISLKIPGELPSVFNAMSRSLEAAFSPMIKSGKALEKEFDKLGSGSALSAMELSGALDALAEARRTISHEISKLKV
ncbi:MAG TPA: hypothetical protein DDW94_10260 [Deltaproteobacteria bacterium]|nr:MAG: hypothetical protein A2Z79_00385 [Deltaproteobacteria bacterium GWA2_55_82]OGQ64841.1 MAG: hypothetical protein A3I81_04485 [Deltaproteobacteria bacterium RIFCSPLOWO2_02_FULL_55_12]OIJ73908.1 MAG: hypothetical protein A2V21_306290 [Deltaproteobacteria bacterium GWC2_55_46]HBG47355.1 hypothetical protein [Deltaproteobacteria bacterium]HCY09900.1 hypothetical protein [Deltaproteobacteria bacterium]